MRSFLESLDLEHHTDELIRNGISSINALRLASETQLGDSQVLGMMTPGQRRILRQQIRLVPTCDNEDEEVLQPLNLVNDFGLLEESPRGSQDYGGVVDRDVDVHDTSSSKRGGQGRPISGTSSAKRKRAKRRVSGKRKAVAVRSSVSGPFSKKAIKEFKKHKGKEVIVACRECGKEYAAKKDLLAYLKKNLPELLNVCEECIEGSKTVTCAHCPPGKNTYQLFGSHPGRQWDVFWCDAKIREQNALIAEQRCQVCGQSEGDAGAFLLCSSGSDTCPGLHLACSDFDAVPEGDWWCEQCDLLHV